ncbi:ATP-binding protein [Marinobacter sp. X15-166B]|uniref:ATP-binding protein n=1 Tax=Marinobacter sp. X15-166B TaxID=1897620 RepID=UPI00085C4C5D|nr:ATP-binding protein [Marinobacter sp. X15-166B]OEY66572.1 hypothetical protein BG841_08965 [Marinobacter sp. X15-166B]
MTDVPNSPADDTALNEQLERVNRQLLQSEKMAAIGQLAAGVAHEINNPIGYVYSNLQSLDRYLVDMFRLTDAIGSASTQEELEELKQSIDYEFLRGDLEDLVAESREGIERVKTIITTLMDFTHADEEEFKLADIHWGINTTLSVINNEIKYKAEVVKDFGDLPLVSCIISQINQVILNLLANAAHSIEGFGKIIVRTRHESNYVVIDVEDTGKGISQEHINKVFDPFFTTKPIGEGTGLGLSLSFSIVEKHNGRIDVTSTPGKGTCFRIILPIGTSDTGRCS